MTALQVIGNADLELLSRNIPEKYKYAAKRFLQFLEDNDCSIADPKCWEAYRKELTGIQTQGKCEGATLKPSTVNHYLAAAKERLRYAMDHSTGLTIEQQYALQKMIDGVKLEKRENEAVSKDQILTYDEIQKLIDGCYKYNKPWLALMIEFLAYSGLRVSEMLNIIRTDIKRKGDHYKIQIRGKGNQPGSLLINPDLVERIKKHFGRGTYLFQSRDGRHYHRSYVSMNIKRMAKRILKRDDVSAHTLRHSAGTFFYQKTKDLRMTQKFLRHKSINTTARFYEHSALSFDDIKGVFG